MKTSSKLVLAGSAVAGLGLLFVAKKFLGSALKFKNALTNIVFDVKFVRLHSLSLSTGNVTLLFDSIVKNLTGFTIDIDDLFVMIESSPNGKEWENFGGSTSRIKKVSFVDNQTTTTRLPVEIKLDRFINSLAAKHKYRFIINYDVKGLQQQYIIHKDISAELKTISKAVGLGNSDLLL